MHSLKAIAALSISSVAATLHHNPHESRFELDSAFDDLVERLLTTFHVPGLSLAVIKDGQTTSKGYGYAKLPDTPATADTLWFTGSTTKAFVAAAAGMMVQNNSFPDFKWSTPLARLLPDDFALSEDYQTTHTTLEDALSHRTGLPGHDLSYGWDKASAVDTVKTLRYLPLTAEPRTRWQYCNLMFGTVGAVLEKHTGLHLDEVLTKWVWGPLGMKSTTFSVDKAAETGNLAVGYHWDGEGGSYVPEPYFDLLTVAGAGATISSVSDYALWAQALLASANGSENHTSPLTSEILQALWTPRSFVDLDPVGMMDSTPIPYSLGWMSLQIGEHTVITHSGGLPGFGTQIFLVPRLNFGFMSVGNNVAGAARMGGFLFLTLLRSEKYRVASLEDPDLQLLLRQLPPIHHIKAEIWTRPEEADVESQPVLPLPGSLPDYVAVYSHPAYGLFNVSVAETEHALRPSSSASSQTPLNAQRDLRLLVTPTDRTFTHTFVLTHSSTTFFHSDQYWIHGPPPGRRQVLCDKQQQTPRAVKIRPLDCKDEAVWQKVGQGRAVFEFGPEGTIERLGMELVPEQVRFAGESGRWRDGMIWFERQR